MIVYDDEGVSDSVLEADESEGFLSSGFFSCRRRFCRVVGGDGIGPLLLVAAVTAGEAGGKCCSRRSFSNSVALRALNESPELTT